MDTERAAINWELTMSQAKVKLPVVYCFSSLNLSGVCGHIAFCVTQIGAKFKKLRSLKVKFMKSLWIETIDCI